MINLYKKTNLQQKINKLKIITKFKYLIVILSTLAFACDSTLQDRKTEVTFTKQFTALIALDSIEITKPIFKARRITTNNDFLFVLESDPNELVKIFDVITGEYLHSFGKEGSGPEEILKPSSSGFVTFEDNLVITDLKTVTFYNIKYDSNHQYLNIKSTNKIRIPGSLIPLNFATPFNDSTIYGTTQSSLKHFSIFNKKSEIDYQFGNYPNYFPSVVDKAKWYAYQNLSAIKPDRTKIAVVYQNLPLIRIFDKEGNIVKDSWIKSKKKQKEFTLLSISNVSIDPNGLVSYFHDVQSNDEYIVALFDEIIHEVSSTGELKRNKISKRKLIVLDWDGNAMLELILEDWMRLYTISPKGNLFFLHPEKSNTLYSLELNNLK